MGLETLSKEAVANLSLSRLGDYGGVTNLDSPTTDQERACAKWWDVARQKALKELAPNFALERIMVSKELTSPAFGYTNKYKIPADCVKVLGLDELQHKKNNYSIEGGFILTDAYDGEPIPLRYVKDVEKITSWTPEFIEGMSFFLAYYINMEITQDKNIQQYLETMLPTKKSETASQSAQENKPIRKSGSKFIQARRDSNPVNYDKR